MKQNHDDQKKEDRSEVADMSIYNVGYKKPPRETRFQKGQSGNPHGRPKGVRNFKTDLLAEFQELVRMTEGDAVRMLTKQQAVIKRTMEKACKGDMRAIETLIKWHGRYLDEDPGDEAPAPLSRQDQAILARARAQWAKGPPFSPQSGDT